MGNSSSNQKPTPKDRTLLRDKKIQENIHRVHHITDQWATTTATIISPDQVFQQAAIIQAARRQVERGDRPLTKDDLVAILIRLDPGQACNMAAIQQTLTMRDLITLIRGIIYDPTTLSPVGVGVGGAAINDTKRMMITPPHVPRLPTSSS